nr:uncharacterized protein LOC102064613 [Zonotrichia albicollis]
MRRKTRPFGGMRKGGFQKGAHVQRPTQWMGNGYNSYMESGRGLTIQHCLQQGLFKGETKNLIYSPQLPGRRGQHPPCYNLLSDSFRGGLRILELASFQDPSYDLLSRLCKRLVSELGFQLKTRSNGCPVILCSSSLMTK